MDKREFYEKLRTVVGMLEWAGVKVEGRHVVGDHDGVILALDIGGVVTDRRLDEIGRILGEPRMQPILNPDLDKPRPIFARTLPDPPLRITVTDEEIRGLMGAD